MCRNDSLIIYLSFTIHVSPCLFSEEMSDATDLLLISHIVCMYDYSCGKMASTGTCALMLINQNEESRIESHIKLNYCLNLST